MNLFGGIGLVAAINNYRKLKEKYNRLIERRNTLLVAIQTYDEWYESSGLAEKDYESQLRQEQDKIQEVSNPEDLEVTSVLKVANLVGKRYRAKIALVFSNTSQNKTYVISYNGANKTSSFNGASANAYFKEYREPIASGEAYEGITIKPGETVELGLEKGVYAKSEAVNAVEQEILDYCGKRLITSCPKVNIKGVEFADINFNWSVQETGESGTAEYRNKPGVLRYCQELSLVGE